MLNSSSFCYRLWLVEEKQLSPFSMRLYICALFNKIKFLLRSFLFAKDKEGYYKYGQCNEKKHQPLLMRCKRFSRLLQITNRLLQIPACPVEVDVDSVKETALLDSHELDLMEEIIEVVGISEDGVNFGGSFVEHRFLSFINYHLDLLLYIKIGSIIRFRIRNISFSLHHWSFFLYPFVKNSGKHFLKHLKFFVLLGQSICQMSTNIQLQWIILLLLPIGK